MPWGGPPPELDRDRMMNNSWVMPRWGSPSYNGRGSRWNEMREAQGGWESLSRSYGRGRGYYQY